MQQITLFFTFLLFSSFPLLSQNNNTFPTSKDNPKWYLRIEQYNPGGGNSSFQFPTLKYQADTMLCGKKYALGILENKPFYVRTEGNKTYLKNNADCAESETLIYDFGMKVGDTLAVKNLYNSKDYLYKFKVKSIDSVLFEGKKLKRLKLDYSFRKEFLDYKMEWIEGVGSNEHPLYPLVPLTSYSLDGSKFFTLCTYHHNDLVYSEGKYSTCSSNLLDTAIFPLYKDAAYWNVGKYETSLSPAIVQETDIVAYQKDTTICGELYSKINLKGQINSPTAFVRRAGRQVYYRPTGAICGQQDKLLYDFDLKKGDLEVITHPADLRKYIYSLKSIENVSFAGKMRKQYTLDIFDFDTANKIRQDIWLEGVGSLIHPFHIFLEPAIDGYWFDLLCSYSHQQQQYMNPKYNTCYITRVATKDALSQNIQVTLSPNPFYNTLNINIIEENNDTFDMELFNSMGQKIMQQNITEQTTLDMDSLPQGTYFIKIKSKDGLKNVVKRVVKM
jgi:hypothetical protein